MKILKEALDPKAIASYRASQEAKKEKYKLDLKELGIKIEQYEDELASLSLMFDSADSVSAKKKYKIIKDLLIPLKSEAKILMQLIK